MEQQVNADTSAGRYSVMLPCEPEQFKDFISGLLGKPQTITQNFKGTFEITNQDIETLFHLIIQRVQQQNHGTLIQFTARIVYNDGSSVRLNSLEDFRNYYEVRAVISTQVHLSWTFLIQFADRTTPEKQRIDVSFGTLPRGIFSFDEDDDVLDLASPSLRRGLINFRVEHTARTWGGDIQGMLASHLQNLIIQDAPVRDAVRRFSGRIGFATSLVIFLAILWSIFDTGTDIFEQQRVLLQASLGNAVQVPSKLDFLMESVSTGLWERYLISAFIYLVLGLFLSVLIGIWTGTSASSRKPSFILLTEHAKKDKVKTMDAYNGKWVSFIWSLIFALATGVMGNIIYSKYWL